MNCEWMLDGGYLPHAVIRMGIRRQLRERLASLRTAGLGKAVEGKMAFVERLRMRPMAVETAAANAQHYEVGTGVLAASLDPRMKYSCCLYRDGGETLGQAEEAMLRLYLDRAELEDGMSILDLGCVLSRPLAPLRRAQGDGQVRLGLGSPILRRDAAARAHHGLLQLAHAEAAHRRRGLPPRPGQRDRRDGRRSRLRV